LQPLSQFHHDDIVVLKNHNLRLDHGSPLPFTFVG
jgi:hypothetical protein